MPTVSETAKGAESSLLDPSDFYAAPESEIRSAEVTGTSRLETSVSPPPRVFSLGLH